MSWIENDTLKIIITYFENVTTHTVHLDLPQKKGRVTDFEIIQVNDGQIEIRAPKAVCVRGHQVSIVIQAFSSSDTYKSLCVRHSSPRENTCARETISTSPPKCRDSHGYRSERKQRGGRNIFLIQSFTFSSSMAVDAVLRSTSK